ncbi:MAG: tyrosine-type recombinase/integrase [Vulcanimicrobiota bacterium]
MQRLREHRIRQLETRLAFAGTYVDHGFGFTTRTGAPLHESNVQKAFRRVCKRAVLAPVRLYTLRHTCATLMLLRRVPPKIVSEWLGHASITITLDVYSHVLPSMRQEAAAELEATGLF